MAHADKWDSIADETEAALNAISGIENVYDFQRGYETNQADFLAAFRTADRRNVEGWIISREKVDVPDDKVEICALAVVHTVKVLGFHDYQAKSDQERAFNEKASAVMQKFAMKNGLTTWTSADWINEQPTMEGPAVGSAGPEAMRVYFVEIRGYPAVDITS